MGFIEKALDESLISWASFILVPMYGKLRHCVVGSCTFLFGLVLVAFFHEHMHLLGPPEVVEDVITQIVVGVVSTINPR